MTSRAASFALALLGIFPLGCSGCNDVPASDVRPEMDASASLDADAASSCPHVAVQARCKEGFCLIPAGCFVKGSPPTEPYRGRYDEEQHEVTLTQSFVMADHETTQGEWELLGFAHRAGSKANDDGGRDCVGPTCPVAMITWFEATAFANEKSKREGLPACVELSGCSGTIGVDYTCESYRQTTASFYECRGYRIPTAYEFEYAKRAGTTTAFYTGELNPPSDDCFDLPHLDAHAWYCANAEKTSHPVRQKLPNPWGLYDVMGNVLEYVSSNPLKFELYPVNATDPGSVLDSDAVFGAVDGPYFAWPSLLRSARPGLPSFHRPTEQQRSLGGGVGLGFRLVRSVTAAEAASW